MSLCVILPEFITRVSYHSLKLWSDVTLTHMYLRWLRGNVAVRRMENVLEWLAAERESFGTTKDDRYCRNDDAFAVQCGKAVKMLKDKGMLVNTNQLCKRAWPNRNRSF